MGRHAEHDEHRHADDAHATRPPPRSARSGARSPLDGVLALQQTVGNRAVTRMFEVSAAPVAVQRMFDGTDLKATSSGQVIWKRYTPDKDKGAAFLNHLAAKCGTPAAIDTGRLAAVGTPAPAPVAAAGRRGGKKQPAAPAAAKDPNAVVYQKLAQYLNTVMGSFAANSFVGSTTIHNNGEGRYPVDKARPERYAEFGFTGVGQTRIVFDRLTEICYLSTHYEAPKVLTVNGAAPAAAITYMKTYLETNGYDALV